MESPQKKAVREDGRKPWAKPRVVRVSPASDAAGGALPKTVVENVVYQPS